MDLAVTIDVSTETDARLHRPSSGGEAVLLTLRQVGAPVSVVNLYGTPDLLRHLLTEALAALDAPAKADS